MQTPIRVCYFGTYRESYSRSQLIISGLREQGVTVYEAHAKLWRGIDDRVAQASGGWRHPGFLLRVLSAYWQLFRAHNRTPEYDVMLIGYPGQFDTFLGRLLAWRRRKPMALDVLMSLHLVAEERGLTTRHPATGRLIYHLEKIGLKLPDILIAENREYAHYIGTKYGIPPGRFRYLRHGADDRVFFPRTPPVDTAFRVSYHGSYVASHGLDAIIGAARALRAHDDIQFHFYGNGPEKERISAWADEAGLTNAHFHGYVPREELVAALARSQICLGVFGVTRQALFTIQNKLWEGLAMCRCVLSGQAPGLAETLQHRQHVYLVERNNPTALAKGILELRNDSALRERLAENGYRRYRQYGSNAEIGAQCKAILTALLPCPDRDGGSAPDTMPDSHARIDRADPE